MPAMPARTKKEIEPVVEPVEVEQPIKQVEPERYRHLQTESLLLCDGGSGVCRRILVGYVAWGTESTAGVAQTAQTASQPNGAVVEAPVATQEPQYVRYDVPSEGAVPAPKMLLSPSSSSVIFNARSAAAGIRKCMNHCLPRILVRSASYIATCPSHPSTPTPSPPWKPPCARANRMPSGRITSLFQQ